MSSSLFQRASAFCLSALVTLALVGSVTELFQRDAAPADMALNQLQNQPQINALAKAAKQSARQPA